MSIKDIILSKIILALGKEYNQYTKSVLWDIYNEINNLQLGFDFTYNKAMFIIDSKTPTKLGGQNIDLAKAIKYLKQLVRAVKRDYI